MSVLHDRYTVHDRYVTVTPEPKPFLNLTDNYRPDHGSERFSESLR